MSNRSYIAGKAFHVQRTGRLSWKHAVVAGLITVILTGLAYTRNDVWTSKLSLWTDVAEKTPAKSRVRNSLGNCYVLLGKYFEAIQEYEIALALDQKNMEVYYNLAASYEIVGINNRALYYYDAFCSLAPPDYPDATANACNNAERLRNGMKHDR